MKGPGALFSDLEAKARRPYPMIHAYFPAES
ncbi:MAG: hypothetical protein JWO82_948 [Akkermansiaceae bacterium]|nr:hypothetical protein [Akkermansiaceae bacterium]